MSSDVVYVAAALMREWFPKYHKDQEWIASDDGQNWSEIALVDAKTAIDAYKEWTTSKYAYQMLAMW